ncbi:MAG: right-handed parallel beta-helix repeat-containing protein [Desulfobulbaceae bacterium]|nr:right-handed parallel beta-helix repeat-containing protein [Desulfobulbaceae bacterium]
MIDRTVAGRRWLVIDGNQELRSPLYLRRVFLFLVLSTVLCIIEFVPSVSPAETLYFPRGNLPLQEVVSRAAPGDTIIVAPGIYSFFYESLTIINETLQIKSSHGPEQTILLGRGMGPVVIFSRGSKAVLDGFTITSVDSDRVLDLKGGGIYCAPESAPVITNNVIVGNRAVFGGAIYCDTLSAPVIHNNTILENSASVTGGGIFSFRSSAIISNNRLIDNEAANSGGAIGGNRDSSRITNNIIWKNRAGFGGGISCDRSSTEISNNTLVLNVADYGGGIVVEKGSVRLTNQILWHNTKDELYLKQVGPAARPSYSLIGDGAFRGINGNISGDPLFENAETGNFQLRPDSPCIDSGSIDPFYTDTDGSFNDMGAFGGPGALPNNTLLSGKD